jgi:hypothetical protein
LGTATQSMWWKAQLDSIEMKSKSKSVEVTEVCYDILRHMTVHTRHKLNRNVARAETEFSRKNYMLLELFENPDQFYKCKNQIMNLGHLFNSQTGSDAYRLW